MGNRAPPGNAGPSREGQHQLLPGIRLLPAPGHSDRKIEEWVESRHLAFGHMSRRARLSRQANGKLIVGFRLRRRGAPPIE